MIHKLLSPRNTSTALRVNVIKSRSRKPGSKLVIENFRIDVEPLPIMAQQNSFDIVSQVDRAEINNALNQTMKEVRQRFDFKGSNAAVTLEENELILTAEDETRLRNMNDILQQKLVRRGVPLKALQYGKVEPAASSSVRQHVVIQEGIPTDKAKEIVKFIKDTKVKVQAAIQGDVVRVTGRDRDTLQDVIAKLKAKDFGINMQFTNYRSN